MFNSGFRGKRAADGEGTVSNQSQFVQQAAPIPTINNFVVTDGSYQPTGDTAADPAGGQTIVLNGSGFAAGATIMVGSTVITPVTYLGPTRLAFTSLAASSGSYTVFVTNTTGGTGILVPGLVYSGLPTFTTPAGSLGSYYETTAINNTIVATGDAPITYSVSSGSLPPGSTLSSGGELTGTSPVDASSTTYSFTIQATDAEFQDSYRSFSLTINTDVVTWVSPADNTAYTLSGDTAIANVTLSATSAAGYSVSYTANTLPTGLSLTGNVIAGTPTVAESVSTLLTATAATTGRSATRNISWTVQFADLYFNYVSMLITTTGVNAATNSTFIDSSASPKTMTPTGTPTQGTFSPFSQMGWSNFFNGSTDYIDVAGIPVPGTGQFTVEAWIYTNKVNSSTNQMIYSQYNTSNANRWTISISTANKLQVTHPSGNITGATTVTPYQWNHVAVTRDASNTLRIFLNGVVDASSANYTNTIFQTNPRIGFYANTPLDYFNGYISNLRVLSTALYTEAFTPPTSPLTAVANTTLLTCQSNRFVDNSTNNYVLTLAGTPSVQAYTPFAPTGPWSSSTNGGSGYFNGTTDYIQTTVTAPGNVFTLEGWVYLASLNTSSPNIFSIVASGSSNGFQVFASTTTWGVRTNSTNVIIYTALPPKANQWYHVAFVRTSSTVMALYINGVLVGGSTTAFTFTDTLFSAGYAPIGQASNSYISNIRYTPNTAVYTTNFTPPTAPVSALGGTNLLLNFVNAGVYDAHGTSDLSTIGTAQVSTAQTKYDAASVYFAAKTDYLGIKPIPPLITFAGAFTFECWVYPSNNTITTWGIWDSRQTAGSAAGMVFSLDPLASPVSGSYRMKYYNGTAYYGNITVLSGQWTYLTWVRSGTTMTFYVNGVAGGTATISGTQTGAATTAVIYVGSKDNATAGTGTIGYIESLRITNGIARYTGNFTPPTGSLPQY